MLLYARFKVYIQRKTGNNEKMFNSDLGHFINFLTLYSFTIHDASGSEGEYLKDKWGKDQALH